MLEIDWLGQDIADQAALGIVIEEIRQPSGHQIEFETVGDFGYFFRNRPSVIAFKPLCSYCRRLRRFAGAVSRPQGGRSLNASLRDYFADMASVSGWLERGGWRG